jgi:curved DNA-binding protein CbpA
MSINRKLSDTLLEIHKNRRSGVLRFEHGPEKRQLVLDKGLLVFAESNLPDEHLVRVLVRLDLLPRTNVNEIASSMKNGKTSEEAILELPGSDMKNLETGRREQAMIILASLWGWDGSEMRFFAGENLIRCRLNLGLPLPEALLLSARRAVSSRLVRIPADFARGIFRAPEEFKDAALEFPLSNSESYVLSLLKNPLPASEIFALVSAAEATTEDVLMQLFLLGIVDMQPPAGEIDEKSPATESGSTILQLDEMLSKFEAASLYEILSIPAEANQQEIQAAYHALAKQYHPDRFQSQGFSGEARVKADQIFTTINKAYIVLKDPASRVEYDEKRLVSESKVEAGLKAKTAKQSEDARTAEALYRDGRALLAEGEIEKAIERLRGSVWLDPERAVYHHYLGVAEAEMPKLRKSAEQHFLKALELNKLNFASRLELAKLYIKVELRRKAEQQLRELMRWDPENHEAQRLLAELKKP